MTKLTDTHRVILSTAGSRDRTLILPFPKNLKLSLAKAGPIVAAMLKTGLVAEETAIDGDPVWRTSEDRTRLTLVATTAGLKAIGLVPADHAAGAEAASPAAAAASPPKTPRKKAAKPAPLKVLSPAPTKLNLLVSSLKSRKGASLDELTAATGWQKHSVRGAISGALKKKLGLKIDSSVVEGRGRVYRIVG